MHNIFLGLGSNLEDRIGNLRKAVAALAPHISISRQSSVYESAPHGVAGDQPRYLNMVIAGETSLQPRSLLEAIKSIERGIGRAPETHRLPRPIDIDILFFNEEVIEEPDLVIPHARLHERHFVLVPLEEIAPFHFHPTRMRPIIDLLDELGGYERDVWRSQEQL